MAYYFEIGQHLSPPRSITGIGDLLEKAGTKLLHNLRWTEWPISLAPTYAFASQYINSILAFTNSLKSV